MIKAKQHMMIHFFKQLALIMLVYAMLIQPVVEIFTLTVDEYELLAFSDSTNSEEEKQEKDVEEEEIDEMKFIVISYDAHLQNGKNKTPYILNVVSGTHIEILIPPPEQV